MIEFAGTRLAMQPRVSYDATFDLNFESRIAISIDVRVDSRYRSNTDEGFQGGQKFSCISASQEFAMYHFHAHILCSELSNQTRLYLQATNRKSSEERECYCWVSLRSVPQTKALL